MTRADLQVFNNVKQRQFEIRDGSELALLTYSLDGDVLDLIHTEVPDSLEGRGYGSRLAEAALDFAAAKSLLVKPTCSFVRSYIARHDKYAKLTQRAAD